MKVKYYKYYHNTYMNKFFRHLKTVLKHKYYVFGYCVKFGIPWRGFKHDLSKFSPTEFFESVKYCTGTCSPIDTCKRHNEYSKAWQHHKGRNTHHYEYWQDNFDKGTTHLIMPFDDNLEMLCDFLGASRAYNKDLHFEQVFKTELQWWLNAKDSKNGMHPVNKEFITKALNMLADEHTSKLLLKRPGASYDLFYSKYIEIVFNYRKTLEEELNAKE